MSDPAFFGWSETSILAFVQFIKARLDLISSKTKSAYAGIQWDIFISMWFLEFLGKHQPIELSGVQKKLLSEFRMLIDKLHILNDLYLNAFDSGFLFLPELRGIHSLAELRAVETKMLEQAFDSGDLDRDSHVAFLKKEAIDRLSMPSYDDFRDFKSENSLASYRFVQLTVNQQARPSYKLRALSDWLKGVSDVYLYLSVMTRDSWALDLPLQTPMSIPRYDLFFRIDKNTGSGN